MPLFNCKIDPTLKWSSTCVINNYTCARTFLITETKLYVPVVTLSTPNKAHLLHQQKPAGKRKINWNKHKSKPEILAQSRYFNHLADPTFQGVNCLFVLSLENENGKASHGEYYLPKIEIKHSSVKIFGRNFFDQKIKSDIKIYDNTRKSAGDQGDHCLTGFLLDYSCFKES